MASCEGKICVRPAYFFRSHTPSNHQLSRGAQWQLIDDEIRIERSRERKSEVFPWPQQCRFRRSDSFPAFPGGCLRSLPSSKSSRVMRQASGTLMSNGHQRATLYDLYAWKNVAERAYGIDASFLVARDGAGERIRGVLPLFRVPRPGSPYLTNGLFGAYATSSPTTPTTTDTRARCSMPRSRGWTAAMPTICT